jgi:hypothetical protein
VVGGGIKWERQLIIRPSSLHPPPSTFLLN